MPLFTMMLPIQLAPVPSGKTVTSRVQLPQVTLKSQSQEQVPREMIGLLRFQAKG